MLFSKPEPATYVSRVDAANPLSSYSPHPFLLDDLEWPTVEHYFHGMKFNHPDQRVAIRGAPTPHDAEALAEQHADAVRKDWKQIQTTIMTRALYIKCRTYPDIAEILLSTQDQKLVETSLYDYFWGCGRDGRGHNHYGKVLMNVRERLRQEQAQSV